MPNSKKTKKTKKTKKIAIATLGLAALGAGIYASKKIYNKTSVEKAQGVLVKFNSKYGGFLPTWLGGNKSAPPKLEKLAIELQQTINKVEELKNQPEKKNELQKECKKMEIQKNQLENEGDITPKASQINKSINSDELKLKLQLEKYNKEIEELEEIYDRLEKELNKTNKTTNKYKQFQKELRSIDNKLNMLNIKKMVASRNIEKVLK